MARLDASISRLFSSLRSPYEGSRHPWLIPNRIVPSPGCETYGGASKKGKLPAYLNPCRERQARSYRFNAPSFPQSRSWL
ncbi:hypothetical protein MRX96_006386 [Rhipicephalus microplus]